MIKYLAKRITNYYINKNKIKEDEREMFEYCFDLLLSTLFNLLAIVIISIATGLYIEGAIFCIVFMTLRGVGGGYHANTHFLCFITIMTIFISYVLMLKFINVEIMFVLSIAFLVVSFFVIAILAPVDTETKPLTKEEFKKNKIKTLVIMIVYTLATAILLSFEQTRYYSFNISCTMFMVSLLMIIGKIKNIASKKH